MATARAADVRTSFATGDFSLRLLVLIGGIGLIVSAFIGLFVDVFYLDFTNVLLEVYTLALGGIIMILESQQIALPPAYLEKLLKYALFLKFIWGRGLLYAFAGTLQAAQGSLMDRIVGVYVMILGMVFIILGYRTSQKLASVGRRSFTSATLKSKFNAVDTDKKGSINLEQFSKLLDSLEIPLDKREKEIAFLYLDGGEGTMSFDEFQAWFVQDNTAPIM